MSRALRRTWGVPALLSCPPAYAGIRSPGRVPPGARSRSRVAPGIGPPPRRSGPAQRADRRGARCSRNQPSHRAVAVASKLLGDRGRAVDGERRQRRRQPIPGIRMAQRISCGYGVPCGCGRLIPPSVGRGPRGRPARRSPRPSPSPPRARQRGGTERAGPARAGRPRVRSGATPRDYGRSLQTGQRGVGERGVSQVEQDRPPSPWSSGDRPGERAGPHPRTADH